MMPAICHNNVDNIVTYNEREVGPQVYVVAVLNLEFLVATFIFGLIDSLI